MMESNRLTELVKRLRDLTDDDIGDLNQFSTWGREMVAAADAIELLQRELKCANELWDQQKELALEYLDDIEKANERIAELEAALKPFADEAQFFVSKALDTHLAAPDRLYLTIGQFRAARKVLGEKE
jgi:hypothetical protein